MLAALRAFWRSVALNALRVAAENGAKGVGRSLGKGDNAVCLKELRGLAEFSLGCKGHGFVALASLFWFFPRVETFLWPGSLGSWRTCICFPLC